MSTELEISIRKGADCVEPLLNDEDVKELYSLLGEYYPEVTKISYEQGMDIFTPFVVDREHSNREIWIVNVKISDTNQPGLWQAFPTLDLKGLPSHGEPESGNDIDDENTEGIGSAIGVFGLPPLLLPEPEDTPKPRSSIQLPASYGDGQPSFGLASSDKESSYNGIPARNTISLPEIDDDMADLQSELPGDGQAVECIIGLAFALPSIIHLGEAGLPQSNDSHGPSTLFKVSAGSKKGKQPEADIQSYDIGILLNVDLIHRNPLFRGFFEDEVNIESMKTTWTMEAIYRILLDLEHTVKFDDDLQIRVVIQRSMDAIKREICDSVVSAFILAGFETPEESTAYELFDQTILATRTGTWKNHKDILWASIRSSHSAHPVKVSKEGKVVDSANSEVVGKGKRKLDKGKGKAVDKGKGKAVDQGYEEATPDSLGLLGLDTSLGLFE